MALGPDFYAGCAVGAVAVRARRSYKKWGDSTVIPSRRTAFGVYGEVLVRHPDAAVIVPPRSNAVPSPTAETEPTPRDRHLQVIAEHGRMNWQKASGYNWRALVEADIGRWKRVIGHALRSQTAKRQATEVAIAVDVLNRMLELGRPSYVRIA